jgi:mRNA interferase MazF
VVQADGLDTELPRTIVAMITSNMMRAGRPGRVVLLLTGEIAKRTGLLMDSVIMTGNLATVHYAEIDRVVGRLPDLVELDGALRATLAV